MNEKKEQHDVDPCFDDACERHRQRNASIWRGLGGGWGTTSVTQIPPATDTKRMKRIGIKARGTGPGNRAHAFRLTNYSWRFLPKHFLVVAIRSRRGRQ